MITSNNGYKYILFNVDSPCGKATTTTAWNLAGLSVV